MSLLLSELILRHEGIVRRSTEHETEQAGNSGSSGGKAGVGGVGSGADFLGEANLLELLSDLVLHLPACATAIHRYVIVRVLVSLMCLFFACAPCLS